MQELDRFCFAAVENYLSVRSSFANSEFPGDRNMIGILPSFVVDGFNESISNSPFHRDNPVIACEKTEFPVNGNLFLRALPRSPSDVRFNAQLVIIM